MITRMEWSAAMSVGVPALDADHRCLIQMIDVLHKTWPAVHIATIGAVLDGLDIYVRYHFAREERVMEACGFPFRTFHRAEHKRFDGLICSLRERSRAASPAEAARDLYTYLSEWLRHHVLNHDMAYRAYVTDVAAAEVAARGAAEPVAQMMTGLNAE
jgi:hemerythrin-like metal-binding protein